jgi:hypothetical protein
MDTPGDEKEETQLDAEEQNEMLRRQVERLQAQLAAATSD